MDRSLPGSALHGILQARVLEWVAVSFSRGSSQPRDRTQVSLIPGRRFNLWATREASSAFVLAHRHEIWYNSFGSLFKHLWKKGLKHTHKHLFNFYISHIPPCPFMEKKIFQNFRVPAALWNRKFLFKEHCPFSFFISSSSSSSFFFNKNKCHQVR